MASRRSKRLRNIFNLNRKDIKDTAANINDSMKSLYSDSYLSSRDTLDSLSYVADKMEDNINDIIMRNNTYNVSDISKLYSRILRQNDTAVNVKNDGQLESELENLFSNTAFTDAVLGSYLNNKWIKDYDKEIDTVLKFNTKMKTALDILKDSVLSADSTSKEIINPSVRISDNSELKIVMDRIDKINTKYCMNTKSEDWYDEASTYGEALVYRVPYKKAIKTLLQNKSKTGVMDMPIVENGVINSDVINESANELKNILPKNSSFSVEIDTSRMLSSCVEQAGVVDKIHRTQPTSLMESFISEINEGSHIHESDKLDRTISDELDIPDGLNVKNKSSISKSQGKDKELDVRGCVLKTLDRENLIRLYIDDILIGYYYVEFKNKVDEEHMTSYTDHSSTNMSGGFTKGFSNIERTITDNIEGSRVEHLMKLVAKQISNKLDATFVNSNQDLTEEIYAILKYNDVFNSNTAMKVSFLPPEDVKRLVFKEDPKTHIGISDIQDGLIPAKLLAMLYTTYVLGTLTRGQDKRVYYVKQTVETNIAQTLLNVINQIKKSNFNMRSIENLNNLLNITGRFNDFIIPVGPSGDSPIQFEIMPGQQFEINQDLFNMLDEAAVESTGVPMEVVQARLSPEFATQYISSSLKLIRKVFRRQARVELFLSELLTDIYATEYDEYIPIKCELPPPVFLSMVNTNQLLENTKQWATSLAELEYDGDTSETVEQEKAIFIRKIMRSTLSSYLKPSEIDSYKADAKFEVSSKSSPNNNG